MPRSRTSRLVTFVLAIFLFFSILPAPVRAAEPTVEEIEQQITRIYSQAKSRSGKGSMSGYCGALVNWQIYLLGIDSKLKRLNGKDEYNVRAQEEITSGGYYTRCFPDDEYSLEEALNAITMNGTRNAYNLMVGFQWTKTTAGRRYGHTCFISAIIDGIVYFVESDAIRIGGRYYKSGKVITATISEFADDYNSWTDFEGIIEYIKDPYEELCTCYPTDIYVQVPEETVMRTEPCDFEYENVGRDARTIRAGEIFRVECILRNPEGEYWYKAADDAYFKADAAKFLSARFDSVRAEEIQMPTLLTAGQGFDVSGTVTSDKSTISVLRGQIYQGGSGTGVLIQNAAHRAQEESIPLSHEDLNQNLRFSRLEHGKYHFSLSAVVYNHYVQDGMLKKSWQTVDLWTGDFVITDDPDGYVVVELKANGGENTADQAVLPEGHALRPILAPRRSGYGFKGWYTAAGFEGRSCDTVQENTILYAHWAMREDVLEGWHWIDGAWRFYRQGAQCTGWLDVDGVRYYFESSGPRQQGWLELNGQRFYLYENGSVAVGTVVLDDVEYIFDANGVLEYDGSTASDETQTGDGAQDVPAGSE